MAELSATPAVPAPHGAQHWLTDERIRVYSRVLLIIFLVAYAGLWLSSLPGLVDPRGKPVGYDFIAFWSAAWLALQGRPEAAFDWQAIAAAHKAAVPALHDPFYLFLWHYPPTFLLAVLPLALLPYCAALATFLAGSLALWCALIRRIVDDRRYWIVAAAMPAGLINLFHGQNGFLTAALGGFALLLLESRPVGAGILIGLLAIKPHLAVLFPVALVAAGNWRAFIAAAITATLFVLISIWVFGGETLVAFIHDMPSAGRLIDDGIPPWGMPSPYVSALVLNASRSVAAALQGIAALAAAAGVWLAWRSAATPFALRAATLAAGTLLVSPYVFYYDMTWTGLAVGWLALFAARTEFLRGEREILFAAWVAPLVMVPVCKLTGIQIGCVALVLLFAATLRRLNAAPSSLAA